MLEAGSSLRTWALAEQPEPSRAISAEILTLHRLAYLEYEGPVSGGRGDVSRWDCGHYELLSECEKELVVHLDGEKLRGTVRLTCMPAEAQRWTFRFSAESS